LRNSGKIRLVGTVSFRDHGRPEHVYCNGWRPQADLLRHEVLLTDFLLLYPKAAITRGYKVDKSVRADAEMVLGGRKFFVEFDTGEMTYARVQRRWTRYRSTSDFLLVVTRSERRLEGLLNHSERVSQIALFTTLDKVKQSPYGEIWIDCFGNNGALPEC